MLFKARILKRSRNTGNEFRTPFHIATMTPDEGAKESMSSGFDDQDMSGKKRRDEFYPRLLNSHTATAAITTTPPAPATIPTNRIGNPPTVDGPTPSVLLM